MKLIKVSIFLFLLSFTTHAFGRSTDYYQKTLTHILTECNSECRKEIIEQEITISFYLLIESILNQLQFELSQKRKENLWEKDYF